MLDMLDKLAGHVLSSVPPGFFMSCAFDEKRKRKFGPAMCGIECSAFLTATG